ncbi:hypothetical protein [Calothrix sp. 336/3]|uniref:hypothetical protein n=1 Tax=Calothrix sp. 336/3 TaxID=1337936 RepID=UPI000AD97CA5|nr:hypothetical protein [Calothrix sp. 336/3]
MQKSLFPAIFTYFDRCDRLKFWGNQKGDRSYQDKNTKIYFFFIFQSVKIPYDYA